MSTSTHLASARPPSPPDPFDGYPYLVTRIGRTALRHVALLPAEWPRERLLTLARRQAAANRLDTCLCLGLGDTVFIGADLAEMTSDIEPTGTPVIERLALPEALPTTAELAARTARLRDWAERNRGRGYLVGDGLEGGRAATPDDIARLTGTDGAGIPVGLVRCGTCGSYRGDFLALGGEGDGDLTPRVVRVHCRCENHNRCARCGGPLAERRLSAYEFDEEEGRIFYLAAYGAFSHRCDPASPAARPRS